MAKLRYKDAVKDHLEDGCNICPSPFIWDFPWSPWPWWQKTALMCHQPALPALSDASYLLSWTCTSQVFSRDLWDQSYSTVGISSSWTLSISLKAWETLLVKTRAKNALAQPYVCPRCFCLSQLRAHIFLVYSYRVAVEVLVAMFLANLYYSWASAFLTLALLVWTVFLRFSFVAFLLASISFLHSFYSHEFPF